MYVDNKLFDERAIFLHKDISNQEEALDFIAKELEQKNVVTSEFNTAILERERNYPTGLSLENGIGLAIPHTDADKVIKEQIGFLSTVNPVKFKQMGNNEKTVDVNAIFVLCLNSPEEQLEMLQNLMNMFSNREVMNRILQANNQSEFLEIFQ